MDEGWAAVAGAAIGAIAALGGAVLVGFVAPMARERWLRPVLRVTGPDPFPHHAAHGFQDATWYRLIVHNAGRSAARNASGALTISWPAENVLPSQIRVIFNPDTNPNMRTGFEAWDLCWALIENPATRTINPKTNAFLDVAAVVYERDGMTAEQIIIPTEAGWRMLRVCLKPGEYTGTVIISAENAKPVQVGFVMTETSFKCD